MPNYIKNRIELIGSLEDMDSIIKKFGSRTAARLSRALDNSIILKPKDGSFDYLWFEELTGRTKGRGDFAICIGIPGTHQIEIMDSVFCFPDFEMVITPPNSPAYRDEPSHEVAKNSPDWWYNWNAKHWGTKWGGMEYKQISINVFEFDTAWASVPMILEVMSVAFPKLTIKYSWADEDTGHNCGRRVIPKGGSKEAYEVAFDLRPDRAGDYELVDNQYKYKEE
jgi:hypothetical protein